jgi:hypothetical protein
MNRWAIILVLAAAGFAAVTALQEEALIAPSASDSAVAEQPDSRIPTSRHSQVLWSAGMETGDLSQWAEPGSLRGPEAGGGVFNSGSASATSSSEVAHRGAYSAKLTINTGVESGVRLFRWKEPQENAELYYSAWYYIPRVYEPALYWNVFQWKSKHSVDGREQVDPFFALNIGNQCDASSSPMCFYLYDGHARVSYAQASPSAPIPTARWIHVEAYYRCAGDNSGRVAFWQDGAQILDVRNVQTRYADGDCAWSVNNYSNRLTPSPATIYVDDAAICSGARCP